MAESDEIVLYKAPQKGRDASNEVVNGFDPALYTENGPYFTTVRTIAQGFQEIYRNGMQKLYLPKAIFEELLEQGIIGPDLYYKPGRYHVPASALRQFNEAIRLGTQNFHEPEKG